MRAFSISCLNGKARGALVCTSFAENNGETGLENAFLTD